MRRLTCHFGAYATCGASVNLRTVASRWAFESHPPLMEFWWRMPS